MGQRLRTAANQRPSLRIATHGAIREVSKQRGLLSGGRACERSQWNQRNPKRALTLMHAHMALNRKLTSVPSVPSVAASLRQPGDPPTRSTAQRGLLSGGRACERSQWNQRNPKRALTLMHAHMALNRKLTSVPSVPSVAASLRQPGDPPTRSTATQRQPSQTMASRLSNRQRPANRLTTPHIVCVLPDTQHHDR